MSEPSRLEIFVDLSVSLTGFSHFQLLGTGLAETYLNTLESILPHDVMEHLITTAATVDHETGLQPGLLDDPELGPVARNLIVMWYCGTWNPLPDDWRAEHGSSPLDTRHVVSAESYRGGLQWVAAGAHPAGAYQQGFGAWALEPGALTGIPV